MILGRRTALVVALGACGAPAAPPQAPIAPDARREAPEPPPFDDSLRSAPADTLFEWHLVDSGVTTTLRGIAHDNFTIVVGDEGTILQPDPSHKRWKRVPSGTREHLHGAACDFGSRRVDACYAVGTNGTILRWDGRTTWRAESSGTVEALEAVAFSRDDSRPFVYAVGRHGTILRRDPASGAWTPMASGTAEHLRAVQNVEYGAADMDAMFAAGDHGTILRLERGSWRRLASGVGASLRGVSLSMPSDDGAYHVRFVGTEGEILHAPTATGDPWTREPSGTRLAFSSVETVWGLFEPPPAWPFGKIQRLIVAAGARGTVLVRPEPGDSWVRLTGLPTQADLSSVVDERGRIVFVGAMGTILVALDGEQARLRWREAS